MPRPIRTCTVLDCGRTHYVRGFCRYHYDRLVKSGNYSGLTPPLVAIQNPSPFITRDLGTRPTPSDLGDPLPARGGFREPGSPSPEAVAREGHSAGVVTSRALVPSLAVADHDIQAELIPGCREYALPERWASDV